MGTTEIVEVLVAPVLSAFGIELVDVEAHPGHLKLTIDREPRLDIGAISEATAAVSHALDEADAVPGGRYELEVSSPGVERRLRRPEHFARFVGTEIAVRLRAGAGSDGERRFEGRLAAADDSGIVIEPALEGGARRIRYDDLERAHTIFDWRAALASAPSPPARNERRGGRPSAAERSRAAAAARAVSPGVSQRPVVGEAKQQAQNSLAPTDPTMTDDDRHLTETS